MCLFCTSRQVPGLLQPLVEFCRLVSRNLQQADVIVRLGSSFEGLRNKRCRRVQVQLEASVLVVTGKLPEPKPNAFGPLVRRSSRVSLHYIARACHHKHPTRGISHEHACRFTLVRFGNDNKLSNYILHQHLDSPVVLAAHFVSLGAAGVALIDIAQDSTGDLEKVASKSQES